MGLFGSLKIHFLTYEVHLNDADQVAALQATTTGKGVLPQIKNGTLIEAPYNASPPGWGAAVTYGTATVPVLPLIGPKDAIPAGPYLYSEWFTTENNFDRGFVEFTRKSGGWFGIKALFPNTAVYIWNGKFVYDPPLDTGNPDGSPGSRAVIAPRLWLDPMSSTMAAIPPTPTDIGYDLSRDSSRSVDGFGFGMRGLGNQRKHNINENTGGGAITQSVTWERLYLRLRKAGAGIDFWRCHGTVSNLAGIVLKTTPTGQIAVYSADQVNTQTLLGTTTPLELNKDYKLDIVLRYSSPAPVDDGAIWIYLNGVVALTVQLGVPGGGSGLAQNQYHASSDIGTISTGYTTELDIGFWMGASIPLSGRTPVTTGLDFQNGSKTVLVRPNGFAAGNGTFVGDWRRLSMFPVRAGTGDKLTSSTALDELRVTTDTPQSLDAVPGTLGCVCLLIGMHGYRGTNQGQFGYKLGAAARVLFTPGAAGIQPEGTNNANRAWSFALYNQVSAILPTVPFPALELHRIKGNDAVEGGTDHYTAVAEIIGTFTTEDYPAALPAELKTPLPYLGPHNAPYPRTPWARAATPPISPVVIHAGTYVGNGLGQDLLFRAPVNWLWIRHVTANPVGVRWFSSMIGATIGGTVSPQPWTVPDQLIDPTFAATPATPATGVGAVPDRSAQVATIVNANLSLLNGDEDLKRQLLGLIVRGLNADNVGDGNNWGFLSKTDRTPAFTPADIIVWKPSMEHFDVLTDTGPAWINDGVITNPAWIWIAVLQEGSQEQRSIVRISGADPEINQNAETYQYIAVMDPGQRFMLNGAIALHDVNASVARPLIDTTFLALWAFLIDMRPGVDANITSGVKGPGHIAGQASLLDQFSTIRTNAWDMAAGSVTPGVSFNFGTDAHWGYNLWRRDDGSADPGIPKVVKIGTYTGDGGGGDRTIVLTPASDVRPLWAIVVPVAAARAYMRDSSHAGTHSNAMDGTDSTTAIVGGAVDGIKVGALLNTNGVVYNYFVLMGSATGNADGWSINGEFIPVEPADAPGPQWGDPGEEPSEPDAGDEPGDDPTGAPGGGDDDIATDLATACVPYTKRVMNQALTRIGISKRIVNAATDNTEAADVMRGAYAQSLRETLHDFPWPFATRYKKLVLISGSLAVPVNRDWTYAYEQPADCIFERRIAVIREGAVDPEPPPFQLSYDNVLQINRILTNEADATLEYTARPECAAGRGDPLFIEALIWKLASKGAGPLTRIAEVIVECEKAYAAALEKARTIIRPGNPGPRLTAVDPSALDAAAGSLAANVGVVNRGLLRLGANTVANVWTEQSREAESVRLIFEEELKSTLRDYPWAFATRYNKALVLVSGSVTTPANDDWTYAYRLPTDCVLVRRIVTSRQRLYEPNPELFRTTSDDTGSLLYTNLEDPSIEYTARIADCVLRSEPLFRDALAWRLAATSAPALAQIDPAAVEQHGRGPMDRPRERKALEAQLREKAAQMAWRQYYLALEKARLSDAKEQQQDPNTGDAPWIEGRN